MHAKSKRGYGATIRTVDLSSSRNWPRRVPRDEFWQKLAAEVRAYPTGEQRPWGIPFAMAGASGARVVLAAKGKRAVTIPLNGKADYLCLLHAWRQLPDTVRWEEPAEGLVVAEYMLSYRDGTQSVLPVRARFEVDMTESPGLPWVAVSVNMPESVDPASPPDKVPWGPTQTGVTIRGNWIHPSPLLCPMANPHPDKQLRSLTIRGLQKSPLVVAGLTLYQGMDSPIRHLPRRMYRVNLRGKAARIEKTEVDLGTVTRIERTAAPLNKQWLKEPYPAIFPESSFQEPPERHGEDLIEIVGAPDAKVSVTLSDRKKPLSFSVGDAFHKDGSAAGRARLEVLGKQRQWMQVRVIDRSTAQPTPVRIHFSGARGEYLAPYGHHAVINPNWFEDYGADVIVGGRNYAYVPGEFTTDMPVGEVYVEIWKGFEYQPVRTKLQIRPGRKKIDLAIDRWKDLRSKGWVTADTHVHFISPHTAWLEGQAEGVNVINLLASQWGRLFTNVGDVIGKPNVVENDTIVFVGTENRNHMLGHMSMLGTKDLPVYPMCCGGPGEAWIGDPDFRLMAEWALENKRKGGVVIRPHYPRCGHTEDPVPILKGLVDALEIRQLHGEDFPTQEWYRYLNCGYRVAVCGGTDKMKATNPVGWMRTYARLDPDRPFTYGAWASAIRAGRTVSTTGPLVDLQVEGRNLGDTIRMPTGGGALEFAAVAECFAPLSKLEIVADGRVIASAKAPRSGAKKLCVKDKVRISGSGWIAARCFGIKGRPGGYMAAHTSPVYIQCGRRRAFDGPAAEHMLALVEGGIEYYNKLATVFDESSRRRMVKLFNEARRELKGRLVIEAGHNHHHGKGPYHTHGRGGEADHKH